MDTDKFYGPHTCGNSRFIISVDVPDEGNVSNIGDTDDEDDVSDDSDGGCAIHPLVPMSMSMSMGT